MWEALLAILSRLLPAFAQTFVAAVTHFAEQHPDDALIQAVKDLVSAAGSMANLQGLAKRDYVITQVKADFPALVQNIGDAALNFLVESAVLELKHLSV